MIDEELYNRQKDLNLNQVNSAIIVGLGGTGSWVALLLALSGSKSLLLMDADKLEPTNFNRIPVPKKDNLGKLKTVAISDLIRGLRPDCFIQIEGRAGAFTLEAAQGDWLFDCTDSQPTQMMLADWAKKHDRRYVRCGYDGTHMTVTDRVPTWNTKLEARTGYEITPSWAVPAAMAACFAVSKAMYCPETEVGADLKEIWRKA